MSHEQLGHIEQEQPVVFEVIPKEKEGRPGQIIGYSLRVEGASNSSATSESFEEMVRSLTEETKLDLLVGLDGGDAEELKQAAEALKAKLNNPELQAKIRRVFQEREELREYLSDI